MKRRRHQRAAKAHATSNSSDASKSIDGSIANDRADRARRANSKLLMDAEATASASDKTAQIRSLSWPRRILNATIAIPAVLWIFLEEWLWDNMVLFMAWLGRLPPIRWLEARLAALPPYAALIAFLIPAAILLPFKLAAFWLIAHGQAFLGGVVFIIAKIIGTAFLARIFSLTKPSLMTIVWFAACYNKIIALKERLYGYVRALPAYVRMRAWMRAAKTRVKAAVTAQWRRLFGS